MSLRFLLVGFAVSYIANFATAGPEIGVEHPLGNDLTNGASTINLGNVTLGQTSSAFTITIRNTGDSDLINLEPTFSGAHALEFKTDGLLASTLQPVSSASFDVYFEPGDRGVRIATLSIANNDPGENPFEIALVGFGMGPGDLDRNFGSDGFVATPVSASGSDLAWDIVIQNDGKILLGGYANQGGFDFALARYNADGSLDTNFGVGGKVRTPVGATTDLAQEIALQRDGKILLGGHVYGGSYSDFSVVRYLSDGALDTSFDGNGKAQINLLGNDELYSVAIQDDDKILLAGATALTNQFNFGLARLNADGSPDTDFGSNGVVNTDFNNDWDEAHRVLIQDDGKILLVGIADNGLNYDFAIARYLSNGALDIGWDLDGKVTTAIGAGNDFAQDAMLLPDGKLLVLGFYQEVGSGYDLVVARYDADGSLDETFGDGGLVKHVITANDDRFYELARYEDGTLVLVGYSRVGSQDDLAVVRLNEDGKLDPLFGNGGFSLIPLGSGNDNGQAVAIDSNGDILAGGYFTNGANTDFFLARLVSAPLTDIQAWRWLQMGSVLNRGPSGDEADFEDDGLLNLLEFVLGADPTLYDAFAFAPRISINGVTLQISFIYDPGFDNVIYTVQTSTSLLPGSWVDVASGGDNVPITAINGLSVVDDTGSGRRIIHVTDAIAFAAPRFIRLKVTTQ